MNVWVDMVCHYMYAINFRKKRLILQAGPPVLSNKTSYDDVVKAGEVLMWMHFLPHETYILKEEGWSVNFCLTPKVGDRRFKNNLGIFVALPQRCHSQVKVKSKILLGKIYDSKDGLSQNLTYLSAVLGRND